MYLPHSHFIYTPFQNSPIPYTFRSTSPLSIPRTPPRPHSLKLIHISSTLIFFPQFSLPQTYPHTYPHPNPTYPHPLLTTLPSTLPFSFSTIPHLKSPFPPTPPTLHLNLYLSDLPPKTQNPPVNPTLKILYSPLPFPGLPH